MSTDDVSRPERPRTNRARYVTQVRFDIDVYDRLAREAEARDVSITWMVNRACSQFLDRLVPLDDIRIDQQP